MEKKKNLFKQYWWIFLSIIIIIPCIINFIMIQPRVYKITGNDASWLSFWGGYIGSIISASIAIFILWKQLNQNHEENEVNRKLQIDILRHGQEKARLSELRKAFANIITSFNYFEIDRVWENMISDIYKEEDCNCLKNLIRDVDEKKVIIDMYLPKHSDSEILKKYNLAFEQLYNIYFFVIKDLTFFFNFIKNIPQDKSKINTYVKNRAEINIKISPQNYSDSTTGLKFPKSIGLIINELMNNNYTDIIKKSHDILRNRFLETINDPDYLDKFKTIVMDYIQSEEKRIDELYNIGSTPKETSETS